MDAKTRNREHQPCLNRILQILMWLPGYPLNWLRANNPDGLIALVLFLPEGMTDAG